MKTLNYKQVFEELVDDTKEYLITNKIQAMILGISGGIDSAVTAAICSEVSRQTGIPLIGRSLPIKNKNDEFDVSKLVGEAFCNDFKCIPLQTSYIATLNNLLFEEADDFVHANDISDAEYRVENKQTPIANGNIQARLRMIYLYNLASIHKGIVISTDNQTEYQLGFWTLHGDVGDFNPLFGLWKTEVYELASWLARFYSEDKRADYMEYNEASGFSTDKREKAIRKSIALTPTDGLGISNSDLEQIGAKSYQEVDDILQEFEAFRWLHIDQFKRMTLAEKAKKFLENQEMLYIDIETIMKVIDRYVKSEFKRKNLPICIGRNRYEQH